MSAATRRLRIPSSGPFVIPEDGGGEPPLVGEGTPGRIYRFMGDSVAQTFPNAGPITQFINFLSYDLSMTDPDPSFPEALEEPFWVDFELYLEFLQLGTTSADIQLEMNQQAGWVVPRVWNQVTIGTSEDVGYLWVDRQIPFTLGANPQRRYTTFRVEATLLADAGDVILNNPQCYAKFTLYSAPPAV